MPDLDRALADALLAWYDQTHGTDLGHDHHCPIPRYRGSLEAPRTAQCTCGWAGVVAADQARVLAWATAHRREASGDA